MESLCRRIGMPEEVISEVMKIDRDPEFHPDCKKLLTPETWDEGLAELKKALAPDPDGFKMLCAQLRCAKAAEAEFRRLGFNSEIYEDTMAAFSRFVKEHLESFGHYGFDREFWMVRQISCMLFRIGQLEYELTYQNGELVIELHIPSDTDMSLPGLRQSYLEARKLLNEIFPEFRDARIHCHSWLLSPDLGELLPKHSKILKFQRAFSISPAENGESDVILWVFKNRDYALEDLPETTSLQRSMKKFLLAGGVFHDGEGFLSEDPFLD